MWNTHPAIADCVWERILSVEGAYTLFENARVGVTALATLATTCHAFHDRLRTVYIDIDRPYLGYVNGRYALRVLCCELAQRRMLSDIFRALRLLGLSAAVTADETETNACVAGGFAAWHLERHMDARSGRDAFPRTVRGPAVWDGAPRREVWVPRDIDVFLACDDDARDLAMDVVATCYAEFTRVAFGCIAPPERTREDNAYVEDDAEERRAPDADVVESAARAAGLPESLVHLCRTARECAMERKRNIVRSVWNFDTHHTEPLFAMRLNVIVTDTPPTTTVPYDAWVTSQFDMLHCAVALRVMENGHYTFVASREAVQSLADRRIAFTAFAFLDATTVHRAVHRVRKYLGDGFSYAGCQECVQDLANRCTRLVER